jgi:hypothetical protein
MERICRNLQQRCSAGAKQQAVQDALVLISESGKLVRDGEYDMRIRHRQQFVRSLCEPSVAGAGLASRTVPVATRVIRDGLVTAAGATVEVAAHGSSTAALDRKQHSNLRPGEPGAIADDEVVSQCTDDIG